MSIKLFNKDWAHRALEAVQPDTWRLVTKARIRIDCEAGLTEYNDGSFRQHLHLRCILLRMLPPLQRVTVYFDHCESTISIQQFLETSSWSRHAAFLQELARPIHAQGQLQATAPFRLVAPSLLKGGQISKNIWQLVSEPFRAFTRIHVQLHLEVTDEMAHTFDCEDLATRFSPDWVERLHVTSGPNFRIISAFKQISSLYLEFENTAIQPGLGSLLGALTSSLKNLRMQNMPFQREEVPDMPAELARLQGIATSGSFISALQQLVSKTRLPELRYITMALYTPDYLASEATLRVALQQFDDLDQALPPHCRNTDYIWTLDVNVTDWQGGNRMFSCLKKVNNLAIQVIYNGLLVEDSTLGQEPEDNDSSTHEATRILDTSALAGALVEAGVPPLRALSLKIMPTTVGRPEPSDKLHLDHLESLEIFVEEDAREWTALILHNLFTCISAPKLSTIEISFDSDLDILQRTLGMLSTYLSMWPALHGIDVHTHHAEEAYQGPDFLAFKAACDARGVKYKFTA